MRLVADNEPLLSMPVKLILAVAEIFTVWPRVTSSASVVAVGEKKPVLNFGADEGELLAVLALTRFSS